MKPSQEVAPKSKFSLSMDATSDIVAVKSGERVCNDTLPTIETASQINKFRINKLASELLGVTPGMRIKILVTKSTAMDGKYLVVVAPDTDASSAKVASAAGKDGYGSMLFNYAGIWSRMTQATVDALELGGEAFVEQGVAVSRSNTYYIDHKTIYEVVEVDNYNEANPLVVNAATGESYSKVFALVNAKKEDVDITKEASPRKAKVSETAVEVEDVEEVEEA